jgi:hypothetical protein
LKQAGLVLDAATANVEVRRWLDEVANCRLHRETGERPVERLAKETLQPLPRRLDVEPRQEGTAQIASWPVSPLQRSPLVYEQLLQEGAL